MNGQESGLYKGISVFGKVSGIGLSIMGTPTLFGKTRAPIYQHLAETWGHNVAKWLTWAMCGVEALLIYTATSLLITASIVWLMTWFATRRYRRA